jgi:hypothetical protein
MAKQNNLVGILVTFFIEEEQFLFIMLSDDGGINRMGTGLPAVLENDLFIGKTSLSAFESLRKQVNPKLLKWFNVHYADPALKGKRCKLTLGLKQKDGTELMSVWEYGSESQGPPSEIANFAVKVIEITNPWYEEQKKIVKA